MATPGMRKFHLLLVCTLLFAGCGGAQKPGGPNDRAIDKLRLRAAEEPQNRALQLELATGEHLYEGGDPERARKALSTAQRLAPDDLRITYLAAEQHVLEGQPAAALAHYLQVVERAASSKDPLAPLLSEAALMAVLDMNDVTDDYRERVRGLLGSLQERAAGLGLASTHQLRMALLVDALQRGDAEAARGFASQAGCVQRIDVAGPFGPRELLDFDRALPAEAPGAFAAEHDLGPGRGKRPTRTLETRRCAFGLGRGAHDPLPGTHVARAELETQAGSYALRLESPNSYAVWVDGRELARVDLRGAPTTGVRYLPLQLGAGKHELKVKVSSRHPNPVLSVALIGADSSHVEQTRLPVPRDEFERFVIAKVALARGAVIEARELVRKRADKAPTAHWLVLESATALADPLQTPELRRDRARELLGRAERQNARAWYPSFGLARLASAEGRSKEAIEALRSAVAKWPEAHTIVVSLIEQLRENGYVEEADRRLAELQKSRPRACSVLGHALASARSRGRMSEVAPLSEQMMQCDATSSARLQLLKTQRKYDEAAKELTRLEHLGEPLEPEQALEGELERARLTGNRQQERALRDKRAALWPDRPEPVLDRADLMLAAGDRRAALSYLAQAIDKHPGDLYELHRVREALSDEELFVGLRKRGEEVIRAFEASKQAYDGPEALVLDYTAVRVFPDGSSVSLTHNIVRVQSQEAVDQRGEFSVPDGARLLSLHTRKADGTRLEPDAIPQKSSWSMPNLAPGDYVEFEFVSGESPSTGFPGGYLGDRFYFKSFEVPFDHSELVVVMPSDMEAVLDPRGPLPELKRESQKGLTVLRWTARQSRALSPEPSSVSPREFLPSINLGVKVTWEAYLESLRDLLADRDVYDPAAQEFVMSVLGPVQKQGKRARTEKLYRWVTEQVEATNDVFGLAPAMLRSRTGSRERVLRYMLTLAGVESDLVLVRGAEADHSEAALPDPETYGHLVLRVHTEEGPLFLHAGARHAPLGFLPPPIRGEQALVVNARGERIETPKSELDADLRTVELSVALNELGGALVHVIERYRGAGAVEWRGDLESTPAAELSTRFEQSYASQVIPGAKLKQLRVEGRTEPEAPLVLDYELEVDDLGQRVENTLRIPGFFTSELSARFARQASRSYAELIPAPLAVDVVTKLTLPPGAKLASLPKGGAVGHPTGAVFRTGAGTDAQGVTLERSLRLPGMRIGAGDYPAFASFCRTIDALEASDIVIELPASAN